MNRTLLLMAVAAVATSGVKAQSVTYNHDSPKQNQITVMETGTGALSPELYYTLLQARTNCRSARWRVSISTIRQMKRKPLTRLWSNVPKSRR